MSSAVPVAIDLEAGVLDPDHKLEVPARGQLGLDNWRLPGYRLQSYPHPWGTGHYIAVQRIISAETPRNYETRNAPEVVELPGMYVTASEALAAARQDRDSRLVQPNA